MIALYTVLYYRGKAKKEGGGGKEMDNDMTNEVFETLMKAIITIIKDASSKEEAVAKIENLLKKEK